MTALIVYILALVLLCLAFFFLGIIDNCKGLLAISRRAFGTITDKSLDDHSKEKLVQSASLDMLKHTLLLFLKIIVTLSLTLVPFIAADNLSIVSFEESSQFALRVDVLLITTILAIGFLVIKSRFVSKV